MYLGGQLPYGPESSDLGGNLDTNPARISDTSIGTYLLPVSEGGGPSIISPSVAQVNGIVQPPVVDTIPQYSPLALGGSIAYASPRGDYAKDGSLVTLRNRAGRGMGLDSDLARMNGGCESGYERVKPDGLSEVEGAWWLLAGALALVVVGLGGGKKQ